MYIVYGMKDYVASSQKKRIWKLAVRKTEDNSGITDWVSNKCTCRRAESNKI